MHQKNNAHACQKPHIRLIQLSDLHLTGEIGTDHSYQKFHRLLAWTTDHKPDFLLLTGDLVNGGEVMGYDWLFSQLNATGIDYACIAGNHDVTHEHNTHLPFEERTFSPVVMHERLLDMARIELKDWQLLLLNSSVAGQIYGELSTQQLNWLNQTLNDHNKPTIIALHHHPLAVGSIWIDKHKLKNGHTFMQLLHRHNNIQLVLCGHAHQDAKFTIGNTSVWVCPAIAQQFLPFADEFALGDTMGGFRIIDLDTNHCISTNIIQN